MGLRGNDPINPWRAALGAVCLPLLCKVASVIFFAALPFAGKAAAWLEPSDMIKATNGPAGAVFRYLAATTTPVVIPNFHNPALQTPVNEVRAHVAAHFLSKEEQLVFIKTQFTEHYTQWLDMVPKKGVPLETDK